MLKQLGDPLSGISPDSYVEATLTFSDGVTNTTLVRGDIPLIDLARWAVRLSRPGTTFTLDIKVVDPNEEVLLALCDDCKKLFTEFNYGASQVMLDEVDEADPSDDDPTLWCIPCGAHRKEQCRCGLASGND